jgi:predicted ATP-dependent endonuclease of OLD family
MQRAAIFCILQRYADLVAGDRLKRNRTFIFGIEEPESYMHPQAQRTIRKVLKELSVGGDQVLFTTHSSWLVDVACFDEIIRTESKIEKLNERRTVTTVITQLSMDK